KEIEKEGVKVAIVQTRQASDEENYAIDFRYKNKTKDDAETAATNDRIRAAVAALYPDRAGNESFVNYESISATSSQQLINRALLAIGISTVLIFIYIAIRFDLMSGLAAIITMLHDALIMFAITVMTRLQVGGFFIAAVFAVLVFSLINSVVVFDRLREFKKPFKGERNLNYEELGDRAVRATFTNSVFGGLATFATVFVLALVGIVAIRDFTVQLIIGIVASVYSATFISVPLWCRLMRLSDRSYEKRMLKKNPAAAAAKAEEPASETVEEKAESTAAKKSQKNVYSNKYHKKNKKK
ncbi:MAG TPA: hypothetical protein PK245_05005, partial [Clostridia bacterium]|nr:hypothetical protein [Clostridia bacterium]